MSSKGVEDRFLADIDDIRQNISDVKEQLRVVGFAPIPFDDAVARVDMLLNRFDGNDADNTAALMSQEFELHKMQLLGTAYSASKAATGGDINLQVAPFLVTYFRDTIRSAMVAKLKAAYEGVKTVHAPGDVARLEGDLKRKLFDLEVQEERLILRALARRIKVTRRRDADPAAILEAC